MNEVTRFHSRVIKAEWDSKLFRYNLEIEDLKTGETFLDYAEVLINATGWLKYAFHCFRG